MAARASRTPGTAKTRAKTHACGPDPNVPGYYRCGLPEDHVSHQLPPMTDEQHEADRRRTGERP
jgi:hypothetical protein